MKMGSKDPDRNITNQIVNSCEKNNLICLMRNTN